jgi:hypothetical protein
VKLSLRGLFDKRRSHLTDQILNRLVDGELTKGSEVRAAEHLIVCGRCRLRFEQFQRVVQSVASWHRHLGEESRRVDTPERAGVLLTDLYGVMRDFQNHRRRAPRSRLSRRAGVSRRIAATIAAAAAITVVLVLTWNQDVPKTTPGEFLQRSVSAAKQSPVITGDDIARQKIQIRASGGDLVRTLYRDLSGRRRRLRRQTRDSDAALATKLAVAGVLWDDPLSPIGFRDWHDLQSHPRDEVRPSGKDLLTLTTTLSSGVVRRESLTVRASTFHPIERTVQFENRSIVDIAELDYSVVGLDAVDASYFESSPSNIPNPPPSPHVIVGVQSAPSAALLDEAELRARLVLNRLRADDGEQIQVTRDERRIVVKGLVGTDDRSHELEEKLNVLPYVDASIQSLAAMNRHSPEVPATDVTGQPVITTPAGPSPLERWLDGHGRDAGELNRDSTELLDDALTAELDSKEIDGLLRRFPSREGMTYTAGAVRDELIMRHGDRLIGSLHLEQEILASLGIDGRSAPSSVPGSSDDRTVAADRNLALTRELILEAGTDARPAESIAADLSAVILQLQKMARQADPVFAPSTR